MDIKLISFQVILSTTEKEQEKYIRYYEPITGQEIRIYHLRKKFKDNLVQREAKLMEGCWSGLPHAPASFL